MHSFKGYKNICLSAQYLVASSTIKKLCFFDTTPQGPRGIFSLIN